MKKLIFVLVALMSNLGWGKEELIDVYPREVGPPVAVELPDDFQVSRVIWLSQRTAQDMDTLYVVSTDDRLAVFQRIDYSRKTTRSRGVYPVRGALLDGEITALRLVEQERTLYIGRTIQQLVTREFEAKYETNHSLTVVDLKTGDSRAEHYFKAPIQYISLEGPVLKVVTKPVDWDVLTLPQRLDYENTRPYRGDEYRLTPLNPVELSRKPYDPFWRLSPVKRWCTRALGRAIGRAEYLLPRKL